MHPLAEHVESLLAILAAVTAALVTAFVYIWKGNAGKTKEIAKTQNECMATLSERFVPVEVYREDIKEVFKRQADLRDRLPKDFIMRSEADMFMGAVKELKGEISSMRESFEGRMDRLTQQLIRSEHAH